MRQGYLQRNQFRELPYSGAKPLRFEVAGDSVRLRERARVRRSPVLADASSYSVCVWRRLLSVAGRALRHSSGKFDPVRMLRF